MLGILTKPRRKDERRPSRRRRRPDVEGMEGRRLLSATNGGAWVYGARITYSFAPDGTSVGGTGSSMFTTLNKVGSTSAWEAAIEQAAALWSSYANINLARVADNGAAIGSTGNQQDDPNFGDIRFAMVPLTSGTTLAYALLPPPINGGSSAGDVIFNANVSWKLSGGDTDLETVAIHEIGHALGMDHSSLTNAVMYAYYNGIKQSLTTDDIAGIQSVYGAYPSNPATNRSFSAAMNLNSLITNQDQVTLSGQSLTGGSDAYYYMVGIPGGNSGSMSVSVQSTNLSSVSPKVSVYNSAQQLVGFTSLPSTYGAIATYTVSGVTTGSLYYVRVQAASGAGSVGSYGLLINMGNNLQYWIAPPNTVVASQADQGGGTEGLGSDPQGASAVPPEIAALTNPVVNPWPGAITRYSPQEWTTAATPQSDTNVVQIGNTVFQADALTVARYPAGPTHPALPSFPASATTTTYLAPQAPPAWAAVHHGPQTPVPFTRPVFTGAAPLSRWVRNQGVTENHHLSP
jgi:hypothetical protein